MSVNEVKAKKSFDRPEFEAKGAGGRPGSRTFTIANQNHTLGNALRHVLTQNSKVEFAGYTVPHPSEPFMNLRIQTIKDQQPQTTAIDALKESCHTLSEVCDVMLSELEKNIPEVKADRLRMEEMRMYQQQEEMEEHDEGGMDEDYIDEEVGGDVDMAHEDHF